MVGAPEIEAREVESFTDAEAAVARIRAIYERGAARIRERFDAFLAGARSGDRTDDACYPWVGMDIGPGDLLQDDRPSFGSLASGPTSPQYSTPFRSMLMRKGLRQPMT